MSYLTFQKETVGLYRAVGGSGGLSTMGRASAPPSEAHGEKSALGCACGGGPVRVEVADEHLRHLLALNLVGAFVDLGDLGVAHVLLDRIVVHVAVAAEDLHGVDRDFHCAI